MLNKPKMIQVIGYACCGKIFAGCWEPECYEEEEWMNSLREYALKGCKIGLVESGTWKFEKCTCEEDRQKELSKQIKIEYPE